MGVIVFVRGFIVRVEKYRWVLKEIVIRFKVD